MLKTGMKTNVMKYVIWLAFSFSIILETIVTMGVVPDNKATKMIQYVILLGPVFLCLFIMFVNKKGLKHRLFWEELKSGLSVIFVFFILSIYRSILAKKFSFESIMQMFQMIVPYVFAYILINELNKKDISKFMKIAFWITVVGYITEISLNFNSFSDVFKISIFDSYSPFENSTYAEIASGLAAYFIYNHKKMRGYAFLSVILNFLIFKRVLMLMVVVLLCITFFNKQNKKVSKGIFALVCFSWIILIVVFYFLYQPESVTYLDKYYHIDLIGFTRSRIYRLWYVIETGFKSYGLGSTSEYIYLQKVTYLGYEFEMDFIRIMFELGIFAIIIFISMYLKITKRNIYSFCLINFCFLNLLMANGLVKYWGWTFRMITIAIINYKDYNNNGTNTNILSIVKQRKLKI